MKLKYLFQVEFFDQKPDYKQNPLDASVEFPPVKDENGNLQGKSCMADIQEDVDNFNIKEFWLIPNFFLGHRYMVDLTDGHFEIDGIPFEVEGERPLPVANLKFKLIYFRVRRPFHTTKYRLKGGKPVEILGVTTGELPLKYMIGWQCNINGKDYVQKILVQ